MESGGGDQDLQEWIRCLIIVPEGVTLEDVRARVLEHTASYIWELDRFHVQWHSERRCPWLGREVDAATAARVLWCHMRHNGSVDEEWLVAFLVQDITGALPGCAAQVYSSDGQFMLIDAAHLLPRWLDSSRYGTVDEIARNRIWFWHGSLHIIPLKTQSGGDLGPRRLTLERALAALDDPALPTAAPARLQDYLWGQHIGRVPAEAAGSAHRARVWVSQRTAAALLHDGDVCAQAVRSFLDRTADDMRKAAANRVLWPGAQAGGDGVLVSMRFRKSHYAGLKLTQFAPPRGWPLPAREAQLYGAAELGVKLTFGLQIYAQRLGVDLSGSVPSASGGEPAAAAAAEEAQPCSPRWTRFVSVLQNQGYFRDNIPGSKLYKQLLAQAQKEYRAWHGAGASSHARQQLVAALGANSDTSMLPQDEDSDKWIEEEFSKRLQRYQAASADAPGQGDVSQGSGAVRAAEQQQDLSAEDVANGLARFLEGSGGVGGAMVGQETFSMDVRRIQQALESVVGHLGPGLSNNDARAASADRHADALLSDSSNDSFEEDDDDDGDGDEDDDGMEADDEHLGGGAGVRGLRGEVQGANEHVMPSTDVRGGVLGTNGPARRSRSCELLAAADDPAAAHAAGGDSEGAGVGEQEGEDGQFWEEYAAGLETEIQGHKALDRPVDVDLEAVQGILRALGADGGRSSGPRALLGMLGIDAPKELDADNV